MENPVYHVLLEGRRVGPYDRRTIVGMRVKKALRSKDLLVTRDGAQITVAQLLHQAPAAAAQDAPAQPSSTAPESGFAASGNSRPGGGSHSVVQGIHPAQLLEVEGKGLAIPPFKGEVEVRVQTKVLRLSGRFREALGGWKEDRVKFPLQDIAHARLRGTVVDLWIRAAAGGGLQRISLDLLKPEAAGELAEALPFAAPWPGSEPLAARPLAKGSALHPWLWGAVVGTALLVGGVLVWVLVQT